MVVARHREMGQFTPVTGNGVFSELTLPPSPPSYTVYANVEGSFATMDDDATPGFSRDKASGRVRCNPMSKVAETRTFGHGIVTIVHPRTVGGVPRDWKYVATDLLAAPALSTSALPSGAFPSYTNLLTEVATRARSSIKQPDFQGLVSLGELRETLLYLRNPVKGALKLAETVNHRLSRLFVEETRRQKRERSISRSLTGRVRAPTGLNRDDAAIIAELESVYLSIRYGMRPLVKEITGVLENLRDRAVPRKLWETFRASGNRQDSHTWSATEAASGLTCSSSYYAEREITVRCGFLYSFEDRLGSTSNSWGLDLSEVPATAWALLPTSFVADWIVNVSSFIGALTPVIRGDRLCEWTTVREDLTIFRQRSGFSVNDPSWNPQTSTGSVGQDKVQRTSFSRVAYVDLPGVVIKSSALDTFSDVGKVLDLLSISHQQLTTAFGKGKYVATQVARRTGRPIAAEKWYG